MFHHVHHVQQQTIPFWCNQWLVHPAQFSNDLESERLVARTFSLASPLYMYIYIYIFIHTLYAYYIIELYMCGIYLSQLNMEYPQMKSVSKRWVWHDSCIPSGVGEITQWVFRLHSHLRDTARDNHRRNAGNGWPCIEVLRGSSHKSSSHPSSKWINPMLIQTEKKHRNGRNGLCLITILEVTWYWWDKTPSIHLLFV